MQYLENLSDRQATLAVQGGLIVNTLCRWSWQTLVLTLVFWANSATD